MKSRWVKFALLSLAVYVAASFLGLQNNLTVWFLWFALLLWRANSPRPFITIKK